MRPYFQAKVIVVNIFFITKTWVFNLYNFAPLLYSRHNDMSFQDLLTALHERICCHIACLRYSRIMRVKQMSTWNCAGSTRDEPSKGLSNHTGAPTGRTPGTA